MWEIWKELLKAEGVYHSEYHFDVINVGRQVLGNLFADYRDKFTDCYRKKNLEETKVWGQRMDQLFARCRSIALLQSCFLNRQMDKRCQRFCSE